jgi:hypothetical protein
MKNFNVKCENDERNILIEFQPREENGSVMLDYRTTMNPMINDGETLTDDDKTLIFMADTFLAAIARTPQDTPEVVEGVEIVEAE